MPISSYVVLALDCSAFGCHDLCTGEEPVHRQHGCSPARSHTRTRNNNNRKITHLESCKRNCRRLDVWLGTVADCVQSQVAIQRCGVVLQAHELWRRHVTQKRPLSGLFRSVHRSLAHSRPPHPAHNPSHKGISLRRRQPRFPSPVFGSLRGEYDVMNKLVIVVGLVARLKGSLHIIS